MMTLKQIKTSVAYLLFPGILFAKNTSEQPAYEMQYLEQKTDKKIYLQGQESPFTGLCLLYTSPSPRDVEESRMQSSA